MGLRVGQEKDWVACIERCRPDRGIAFAVFIAIVVAEPTPEDRRALAEARVENDKIGFDKAKNEHEIAAAVAAEVKGKRNETNQVLNKIAAIICLSYIEASF
ncbi:hypothetical protein [Pseudomonas sp. PGPR81]|uniref:hypothetical protein n=1 Tax=Pseudomonas sp. PGPR81 TaxID=2913477 RepID=UPI001EDB75D4|nr:hypothetical protein [Pseudomonas sp. PGPR81]